MELGGGVTRSSVTTTVDNPYTISNLWYNCKVNAYVDKYIPVITDMYRYARRISGYQTIKEIPSGHLPADINTSTAQLWGECFSQCERLVSLPDPFYDTSNATNMHYMFDGCKNLITVPNFDTSKVTSMRDMFSMCYNLASVPNFDTSNVINTGEMFLRCRNLTTVPNFNTSKVTNTSWMFHTCYNLTTIPIFNLSKVSNISNMFCWCNNISGNLYIESNNVTNAANLTRYSFNYTKNIYCHANTTTYNTIYANMGNNTYNSSWNTYLYTMEDNYAEISWNGNGVYRFPTNKVMVEYQAGDGPIGPIVNTIIEVSPYTDYSLSVESSIIASGIRLMHGDNKIWSDIILPGVNINNITFRFFKDITNMTANVVDII